MAHVTKVEIIHSEAKRLLRGKETQQFIEETVRKVADRAGPGFKGNVTIGRTRALGAVRAVTAEAERAERKDHRLVKALDAGR